MEPPSNPYVRVIAEALNAFKSTPKEFMKREDKWLLFQRKAPPRKTSFETFYKKLFCISSDKRSGRRELNQSRVPRRWDTKGEREWNRRGDQKVYKVEQWSGRERRRKSGGSRDSKFRALGPRETSRRVVYSLLSLDEASSDQNMGCILWVETGRKVEFAGWIGKGSARLVTRI